MTRLRLALAALMIGSGASLGWAAQPAAIPLTDEELIGRQVVDLNGTNVGDIISVTKTADGSIKTLVIKVGGKKVPLPATSVRLDGDVVRTEQSADDIAKRPSVEDQRSD